MRFKDGVIDRDVDPRVFWWLCIMDRLHLHWTARELVVTSLWRESGSRVHSPPAGELTTAADLRRWYLDKIGPNLSEAFCRLVQERAGEFLTIVLEPEWLSPAELEERGGIEKVDPHIHLQVDSGSFPPIWFLPKGGSL